jgi:zinc transporter ZupT
MALHFIVNDFGLRENHKHIYDYIGRWILAAAVIVGWAIGSGTQIGETAIAVLFAFLAGGIVLNVLKEELPEERESRFWAFGLGVAVYSVLLLAL